MRQKHMTQQKKLFLRDSQLSAYLSYLFRAQHQVPYQHPFHRFIRHKAKLGEIVFLFFSKIMQEGTGKKQASVHYRGINLRGEKICNAQHR